MQQFLQPSDISLVQYKRSTYRPSSQNQHSRLLSSSQQQTREQPSQQSLTTPRRTNRILLKHTGQKNNDNSMEYYPQHPHQQQQQQPPSILRTINRIFDRPTTTYKGFQKDQQRITRELRSLNNTFHSGQSGDTSKSDQISSSGYSQKKRRKDKTSQLSFTNVQPQDTQQTSQQQQQRVPYQQQSSQIQLNQEQPQVSEFEQLSSLVNQTASQVKIRPSSVEIPDGKEDSDQRKRCITQLSTQHPLNTSQLEGDNLKNTEAIDNPNRRFRSESSDPSEACFAKCDLSSLTNQCLNLDASRLKTLLPADLLDSKIIDIPTLVNENADYFRHLLGDCACSKCTCSRCKCNAARFKLTFKNGLSTNYSQAYQAGGGNAAQRRSQQQWQSQNQNTAVPQLTQSNYDTLSVLKHTQPNVDPSHTTVFKKDFTAQDGGYTEKRHVEQYYKNAIPFIATSHYKSNFVDWKTQDPSYVFKRPQFSSAVPDCPMRLTTAYNSSFRDDLPKVSNASANEIKRSQRHQPMENNYCDDKQTEYTKTYQGFNKRTQISTSLPFKHLSETEKYYCQPSWKNQYKSVNMNDFTNEQEFSPCPVELRTKYHHQLLLSQQSQQSQTSGITQLLPGQSNGQTGIVLNSNSSTTVQATSNNGQNSNSDMHSNRSAVKRIIARSTVLPHKY